MSTRFSGGRTSTPASVVVLALVSALAASGAGYQKPPQAVLDILNAPNPAATLVSPKGDKLLQIDTADPTIADVAQPMLRLAGLRINPATNGLHLPQQVTGLTLVEIADGTERKVALPPDPFIGLHYPRTRGGGGGFRQQPRPSSWSADSRYVALTQTTSSGIELWMLDVATAKTRKVPGIQLNCSEFTVFHSSVGLRPTPRLSR